MARPDQTLRAGNREDNKRLFFPTGGFPHGIQLIFKKYDYSDLTLAPTPSVKSE